jgi:hypothetical protein
MIWFLRNFDFARGLTGVIWQVEFLMPVVLDPGAVLIAPALTFSIDAAWFHPRHLIESQVQLKLRYTAA